jgi:O-antigen/teichoic acid export membrane protein
MRMMTRFLNTLLNAFYSTVRPEIGMAYGKGDMPLIRKLHEGACQVAIWLALVAVAGFSLLGAWFLDLWTQGKVELDPWLFAGLLTGMVFYAVWFASSMVFYATSRHHGMAFALVLTNGASVLLAFGLMKLIGLPGAGIAAAAAEIVMLVFVLRRTLQAIDEPLAQWARAVSRPPIRLLRELLVRSGG